LKIKNPKNYPGSILLFLEGLKNCSSRGLRNPKRGSYEVRVKVKVCDYLGIKLGFLTKTPNKYKKVILSRFLEDPLKTHVRSCPTKLSFCQVSKALTNNLKSFKLTREAPKTTLMFCKFAHMCYLNVQAPITIKNAY